MRHKWSCQQAGAFHSPSIACSGWFLSTVGTMSAGLSLDLTILDSESGASVNCAPSPHTSRESGSGVSAFDPQPEVLQSATDLIGGVRHREQAKAKHKQQEKQHTTRKASIKQWQKTALKATSSTNRLEGQKRQGWVSQQSAAQKQPQQQQQQRSEDNKSSSRDTRAQKGEGLFVLSLHWRLLVEFRWCFRGFI